MYRESDLEAVKRVALIFLHMPIKETEFEKMIAVHPVFDSFYQVSDTGDGEQRICDVSKDSAAYSRLVLRYENRINAASCCDDVIRVIRTPFRLALLKHIKQYMSLNDFSKALGDIWVETENPNGDPNVPPGESAKYFKQSDKQVLMNVEEYEHFINLPEILTVYRGVSVGRVRNGLSWTSNKDIAIWFANRFNGNGKKGYLLKADITKDKVLAYFCRRGEEEIVVLPKDIRLIERIDL